MAGFIGSILNLFRKKNNSSLPSESARIQESLVIDTAVHRNSNENRVIGQVSSSQNVSNSDQTDEEYQSINFHGYSIYDPPISWSTEINSEMRWAGKNNPITVQNFFIDNPLTYWSDRENDDASCINKSLKVEKPIINNVPSLPYWPQYSGITPAQRGIYLSWLSQGRNTDLEEIGYAFLFFYGLERRAVVEKKDWDIILDEVNRLLSKYPSSNSFNSYMNQFIAYIAGSRIREMNDSDIRKFFPSFDNLTDESTKVILSWYWGNNQEVQWELSYALLKNSLGFPRTNIVKKSPALLKQLFRKRFSIQFPNGIPFSSEHEQFQLNYRPASPSLLHYVGYSRGSNLIEPLVLPIPRLDSHPYETLKKIWTECVDELKPVVNKLNKMEGAMTQEVYSVLPDLLKEEIIHPKLELWKKVVCSKQPVDGTIILQISEIANLSGIDKRDVLTTSQSKMMTSTIRDFGGVLVPDHTISGSSFRWNDTIVVLPISDKNVKISENFQVGALIFEIAYAIAASDQNVSKDEESLLLKFVSEKFSLNTFEIDCLKGLQRVLEIQPPSLSKICKRLSKHLNPEQKIALANFLGEIVLLDNKFVKEEQKAIKTVFKALEIDPLISDELIKKFLVGHIPDEPITVVKARKSRTGEAIPAPQEKDVFIIDEDALIIKQQETEEIQRILSKVIEQEQSEDEARIEPEPVVPVPHIANMENIALKGLNLPFLPDSLESLDVKYLPLLNDIIVVKEMSKDDFTGLVRKHNLMPQAAFDDINDWADEKLEDYLLEDREDRIVINFVR